MKLRRGCRCRRHSHLFMLERVRQAGDEPFALETCYLSADEFPALRAVRWSAARCL